MMFRAPFLLRYPDVVASAAAFFDGTCPVDAARRGHCCAGLFCHAHHSTRARLQESGRRRQGRRWATSRSCCSRRRWRRSRASHGRRVRVRRPSPFRTIQRGFRNCRRRQRRLPPSIAARPLARAPHPRSDDMIAAANRCGRTGLAWPDRSAMPHRHPAAPAATSTAGTRCPGRAHRPARYATPVRAAAGNRPGRRPFPCHADCMTPDEPVRAEYA